MFKKLDSSNLESMEYNEKEKILVVNFCSGRSYAYSDVPSAIAEELTTAKSAGKFFNGNIRNAFKFEQII